MWGHKGICMRQGQVNRLHSTLQYIKLSLALENCWTLPPSFIDTENQTDLRRQQATCKKFMFNSDKIETRTQGI